MQVLCATGGGHLMGDYGYSWNR